MTGTDISRIGKNIGAKLDQAEINEAVDVPISTKTAADNVLKYLSDTGRTDFNVLARGYDSQVYALQLQKVGGTQSA